jgi:hypothetical protein
MHGAKRRRFAAVKDAQTLLNNEECASNTGQKTQKKLLCSDRCTKNQNQKEDWALSMGQRSNDDEAGKGVQIKLF